MVSLHSMLQKKQRLFALKINTKPFYVEIIEELYRNMKNDTEVVRDTSFKVQLAVCWI